MNRTQPQGGIWTLDANSQSRPLLCDAILILLTAVLFYTVVQRTSGGSAPTIAFGRFLQEVERSNVAEVTIADSGIKGRLRSGETFRTVMLTDCPPLDMLRDKRVVIHRR